LILFHLFAVIHEPFSSLICENCLASLISSANFREKSIENQIYLNSQQNEKEIENEPIIRYKPVATPSPEAMADIKMEIKEEAFEIAPTHNTEMECAADLQDENFEALDDSADEDNFDSSSNSR
jgi:hypothetical protein